MTRYGMTTPQGEDFYYEDPTWLREKMLCAGPEFWNADAGAAVVHRGAKWMELVFHEDYGFSLGYHDAGDLRTYVPWMREAFGQPVRVDVGGNPWYYPEAEFVPRELACAVVEEFCENGQRSARIQWKLEGELGWDGFNGKPLACLPPATLSSNHDKRT
jgi:hypothetical protein